MLPSTREAQTSDSAPSAGMVPAPLPQSWVISAPIAVVPQLARPTRSTPPARQSDGLTSTAATSSLAAGPSAGMPQAQSPASSTISAPLTTVFRALQPRPSMTLAPQSAAQLSTSAARMSVLALYAGMP